MSKKPWLLYRITFFGPRQDKPQFLVAAPDVLTAIKAATLALTPLQKNYEIRWIDTVSPIDVIYDGGLGKGGSR